MRANELRIGNNYLSETGQFSEMSGYFIYELSRSENSKRVKTIASKFKPIPLTEKWLLKFGFVRSNTTELYTFNKDKLSIHLKSKMYINGRTYFNSWCIIEKQIEYVHQLQNLYFSLTGEELIKKI